MCRARALVSLLAWMVAAAWPGWLRPRSSCPAAPAAGGCSERAAAQAVLGLVSFLLPCAVARRCHMGCPPCPKRMLGKNVVKKKLKTLKLLKPLKPSKSAVDHSFGPLATHPPTPPGCWLYHRCRPRHRCQSQPRCLLTGSTCTQHGETSSGCTLKLPCPQAAAQLRPSPSQAASFLL